MITASTTSPTTIAPSHRDNNDGEWGSTTTLFYTPPSLPPTPCLPPPLPTLPAFTPPPPIPCVQMGTGTTTKGAQDAYVSQAPGIFYFLFFLTYLTIIL